MNQFNQKIKEAEIACLEYPISGVNIFLPYGKLLLNNIENFAFERFRKEGYDEVGLPQIIPSNFVDHLRKEELFQIKSGIKEYQYFLSASAEVTCSALAASILNSYRDLPLYFFSKNIIYRNERRNALIKDLEFFSYEFNSFFEREIEAQREREKMNNIFANILSELKIPFILAKENFSKNAPTIFYTYFPFSGYVGSLFWSCVAGKRYAEKSNCFYKSRVGKKERPFQLNAGFTSRLLAAYLAHHESKGGFAFDKKVAPFSVFLPRLEFTDEVLLLKIEKEIKKLRVSFLKRPIKTEAEAFKKFKVMGFPAMVIVGRAQIKIFSQIYNEEENIWLESRNLKRVLSERIFEKSEKNLLGNGMNDKIYFEKNGAFESISGKLWMDSKRLVSIGVLEPYGKIFAERIY